MGMKSAHLKSDTSLFSRLITKGFSFVFQCVALKHTFLFSLTCPAEASGIFAGWCHLVHRECSLFPVVWFPSMARSP